MTRLFFLTQIQMSINQVGEMIQLVKHLLFSLIPDLDCLELLVHGSTPENWLLTVICGLYYVHT